MHCIISLPYMAIPSPGMNLGPTYGEVKLFKLVMRLLQIYNIFIVE